jgi:hypothetical protein
MSYIFMILVGQVDLQLPGKRLLTSSNSWVISVERKGRRMVKMPLGGVSPRPQQYTSMVMVPSF